MKKVKYEGMVSFFDKFSIGVNGSICKDNIKGTKICITLLSIEQLNFDDIHYLMTYNLEQFKKFCAGEEEVLKIIVAGKLESEDIVKIVKSYIQRFKSFCDGEEDDGKEEEVLGGDDGYNAVN